MRELTPTPTLDHDAFAVTFEAMKQGNPQLSHRGVSFELGRVLGEGGTKTVYDTRIFDEPLALALPNKEDGVVKAAQKWQEALREPSATDVVRSLGFFVNTRCEVTQIGVNGTTFPAITLTRYSDLAIEVRDHKNARSSVVKGDIFTEPPTLDSFIETSRGVARETAALIEHGVLVCRDSVNIGRDDNGLHLFLNDLAKTEFEDLNEQDAAHYADRASKWAIGAILGGLSWQEYDKYSNFFDGDDFHFLHGQAFDRFTDIVRADAGISS